MLYLIMFFLFSILFFCIFSNIRYVRKMSVSERNLKMLEDKTAYNTIDEQLLKTDFNSRLKLFFQEKVDNYVIGNQKSSKTESLEKMVAKVYGKKKTYKEWESERVLLSVVYGAVGLLLVIILKNILFIPLALLFPVVMFMSYESILKSKAKEKDWENFIFFPDLLMSLCMLYRVGAVSTIFQGFKKVVKTYDHPVIDEIKKAIVEYDYNKDKYDVLNDLAERLDFKEFTSFTNLVIESEKNNIPIVDTLTEYAFEISSKRKILATNKILQLPEKIDMVMYLTSTPICFIYMILPSLQMAIQQLNSNGII